MSPDTQRDVALRFLSPIKNLADRYKFSFRGLFGLILASHLGCGMCEEGEQVTSDGIVSSDIVQLGASELCGTGTESTTGVGTSNTGTGTNGMSSTSANPTETSDGTTTGVESTSTESDSTTTFSTSDSSSDSTTVDSSSSDTEVSTSTGTSESTGEPFCPKDFSPLNFAAEVKPECPPLISEIVTSCEETNFDCYSFWPDPYHVDYSIGNATLDQCEFSLEVFNGPKDTKLGSIEDITLNGLKYFTGGPAGVTIRMVITCDNGNPEIVSRYEDIYLPG